MAGTRLRLQAISVIHLSILVALCFYSGGILKDSDDWRRLAHWIRHELTLWGILPHVEHDKGLPPLQSFRIAISKHMMMNGWDKVRDSAPYVHVEALDETILRAFCQNPTEAIRGELSNALSIDSMDVIVCSMTLPDSTPLLQHRRSTGRPQLLVSSDDDTQKVLLEAASSTRTTTAEPCRVRLLVGDRVPRPERLSVIRDVVAQAVDENPCYSRADLQISFHMDTGTSLSSLGTTHVPHVVIHDEEVATDGETIDDIQRNDTTVILSTSRLLQLSSFLSMQCLNTWDSPNGLETLHVQLWYHRAFYQRYRQVEQLWNAAQRWVVTKEDKQRCQLVEEMVSMPPHLNLSGELARLDEALARLEALNASADYLPTADFTIDQYAAIFAPILLPLLLPLWMGLIRERNRYRRKKDAKNPVTTSSSAKSVAG